MAFGCVELLGVVSRNSITPGGVLSLSLGSVSPKDILEAAVDLRWLVIAENGLLELTPKGDTALSASNDRTRLRQLILDYIDVENPPWLQLASAGRRELLLQAPSGTRQVLVEAGLAYGDDQETVSFWDALAARARGMRNALIDGDSVIIRTVTQADTTFGENKLVERYPRHEMMKLPRSMREAIASGMTKYFTGSPCPHGHIAPRHTTGSCFECERIRTTKRSKETNLKYNKGAKERNSAYQAILTAAPAMIRNENEREVTDRMDAALKGLTFYFDPTPCAKGHIDKLRYTKNGTCATCARIAYYERAEKQKMKNIVVDNRNLLAATTIVIG